MKGLIADAALVSIAWIVVSGCATGPATPAPSDAGLVGGAIIEDVAGDVVDLRDRPGAAPGYIDVRKLSAASDGLRVQLSLTLAEALPTPAPAVTELLAFNLEVFARDPALPENADDRSNLRYTIAVHSGSMPEGLPPAYHPGIYDWTRGPDPIFISDFPGTLAIAGDQVVVTVSLAALGDPDVIWVGVKTVSVLSTPDGVAISSTGDATPDVGQAWLTLEP